MDTKNLMKSLHGQKDARSSVGIFSRGKNVYNGASSSAHSGGGPQYGRPKNPTQDAIKRRMNGKGKPNAFLG